MAAPNYLDIVDRITDITVAKTRLREALARVALLEIEVDELKESEAILKDKLLRDSRTVTIPLDWRMTVNESAILSILVANAGRVVTRDSIMDRLYVNPDLAPDKKIIDVWVCKIRNKLKSLKVPLDIHNEHGVGYFVHEEQAKPIFEAERIKGEAENIEQAIKMIADSFGYTLELPKDTDQ